MTDPKLAEKLNTIHYFLLEHGSLDRMIDWDNKEFREAVYAEIPELRDWVDAEAREQRLRKYVLHLLSESA